MKLQEKSTEKLASYQDKGYIKFSALFSPEEVLAWQEECDRILALDLVSPENRRTPFRFGSTETPERVDPVIDLSPLFSRLVEDERITSTLRQIFQDDCQLFKDKLILKMPGVDGYQMHQDWAWGWQELCPPDQILSVSIQIDAATEENGCIELFPNYQKRLLSPAGMHTNFREEELRQLDLSSGEKMETQPGDVLIFHSLAPHRSGSNRSTTSRRSLYLTFNAASAGDLRSSYYQNYIQSAGQETEGHFK